MTTFNDFMQMAGSDECCGHHKPPSWVLDMIGPGRRPERGEVRYLILDVLKDSPSHGYQIIQTIEERSGGSYKPSPGTVYPTLQMLEELGLVVQQKEKGRKVFEITDEGRAELAERQDEVDHTYSRFSAHTNWTGSFDFHKMGRKVRRLMRSVGIAMHSGRIGRTELNEIRDEIDRTIERIDKILKK